MSTEQTNGAVNVVKVDAGGLTPVQRRFLRKCRRDPKPLSVLLRECQVGTAAFARWRADETFERAFRRASAGLTRDTLTDLRFTFALCGRIISSEVAGIHKEMGKRRARARRKKAGTPAVSAPTTDAPSQTPGGEAPAAAAAAGEGDGNGKGGRLKPAVYRLCFEVIKVGMGAFVPKGGRRAFPRVDPAAYARLQKAQAEGK